MKSLFSIIFIVCFLFGCVNKKKQENIITDTIAETEINLPTLEEEFIDSMKIGIPRRSKIELRKYRGLDSIYVEIKLFEKRENMWNLKQSLHFLKDGILSFDVEISDFNNDGLNDLTFQSSIAARGGNVIRKLFIFDKDNGNLKFITNSEDFPNISYNKDLDCIDAFRIYGGTQTVFAKIVNDSLQEFANVEIFNERIIINVIDKNGIQKTMKNSKFNKDSYVRFKNYSPLVEYEGEY